MVIGEITLQRQMRKTTFPSPPLPTHVGCCFVHAIQSEQSMKYQFLWLLSRFPKQLSCFELEERFPLVVLFHIPKYC